MDLTLEREEALQRAAEQWKRQLVDVSGRNRLLNYRDLKVGTLDLTPSGEPGVSSRVLESLLEGRAVQLSGLFPGEEPLIDARKRLTTIHRQAQGNLDEKGINTLFAAVGLATWTVETGARPNSPVILIPITANPIDAARWDFTLEVSGDPHVNPVLAHVLRTEHGIESPDEDNDLAGDLPDSFAGLRDWLNVLEDQWSKVRGLGIEARMVMGNFSYTNMAMVADLNNADNLEAFARNDFVAAIAGVPEAFQSLASRIRDPSPSQPDIDPPESEFLVVDADSSQHRAINRVLAGDSEVIWGPPGTGKSQTIANLIAALIAQGKRVLFVAEKRAAIDVVVARLQRVGLSDLVMDAHGGIESKREFAKSMADSIRAIASIPEQDHSMLHNQLSDRRAKLIVHKDTMHQPHPPWNVSPFEVQVGLLGTPEPAQTSARMPDAKARELDRGAIDQLKPAVQQWVDLEGHKLHSQYVEWARSSINTPAEAQEAFRLVQELAETLPDVRSRLFDDLDEVGLAHPNTVAGWVPPLEWLAERDRSLHRFNQLSKAVLDTRTQLFTTLDEAGLTRPHTIADWVPPLEWLAERERSLHRFNQLSKAVLDTRTLLFTTLDEAGLTRPHTIADWLPPLEWMAERERSLHRFNQLSKAVLDTRTLLFATLDEAGLAHPHTIADWLPLLEWLAEAEQFLKRFHSDVYRLDHTSLITILTPRGTWWKAIAQAISPNYRAAKKSVQDTLRTGAKLSRSEVLSVVKKAADQMARWHEMKANDGYPRVSKDVGATRTAVDSLMGLLKEAEDIFSSEDLLKDLDTELEKKRGLYPPIPVNLEATRTAVDSLMGLLKEAEDIFSSEDLLKDLDTELEKKRGLYPPMPANLEATRTAVDSLMGLLKEAEDIFSSEDLLKDLDTELEKKGGLYPPIPANLGTIRVAVDSLVGLLKEAEDIFSSEDLLGETHDGLAKRLDRLASQQTVAANLPRLREMERRLADAGVDSILAAVGKEVPPEHATDAIEYSWLRSVWNDMVFHDPDLAGFTGAAHNRRQREFIQLDRQHLDITPQRIKRAAAEAAIEVMNDYPVEKALVNREAAKKTRHLPVRRLFQEAPHMLTAIRPCWAMSPLLVAELIPADADLFDVVIFDEASQIPPAEAIGSLARAPQAVIAGDDRQLPPTTFFARHSPNDDDDDDDPDTSLTTDIESILDVAKASPIREEMLQWHYRSRDGRLIAFSNTNIYGEALTAFPGIASEAPLTHHLVPFRPLAQRSAVSHPDEVERVVDMIVDHARQRPDESLGVIAFGIQHANNIDNALRIRLHSLDDQAIDRFFSEEAEERFFVKNIERVQGDERDVIILSVGYHKADNGTLPYRFGPLNQEGGERRLNVAVTRARSRMHLVSSFSHHDMEPGRSDARGVELLRQYLEFAASGGGELGTTTSNVPLNAFELDVMHRLKDKGIPVTPQYGVAGYRIDFACAHPNRPGRMVLAIEADGASYHSAHTARDRDRLRQEVLEGKGWQFHRIWSTDWFRDRDKEVSRAVEAWKQAVSKAEDGDAAPPAQSSTEIANRHPSPSDPAPPTRGRRPGIMPGLSISEYTHYQLVSLARWILSDTLLRTDDDLMKEMRKELGFKRSGSRIDAAFKQAIAEARQ